MKDSALEIIALLTITTGLIISFFFVLDYTPRDAFFSEDDNAFIKGTIIRNDYGNESGWTYMKIHACKDFDAFYEGIVYVPNETIELKGSFQNEKFMVEEFI